MVAGRKFLIFSSVAILATGIILMVGHLYSSYTTTIEAQENRLREGVDVSVSLIQSIYGEVKDPVKTLDILKKGYIELDQKNLLQNLSSAAE